VLRTGFFSLFFKELNRMSAGEVQLAALGMQDAYLTGTPQLTYFKGVYRRHTPFAVQSFNIPFQDQRITWGSQAICRIPFKGDMIQSTTLAVTLPQLFPGSINFQWNQPVKSMATQPYLIINPSGTTASVLSSAAGFQQFFVVPSPPWLGAALSPYVSYSTSSSSFLLASSVTSVAIYTKDIYTVGVFWGLDPNGFTSTGTLNGIAATYWSFNNGGLTNFTVLQSGWVPYNSGATNISNSLLFVPPTSAMGIGAPVIFPAQGSLAQFTSPTYIQFQNFSNVIGVSSLISYTKSGGNLQFAYTGAYSVMITPSGLGAPTRIGIGHTSQDARPVSGYTYDYVYTYNVQFTGQNARAVLFFNVTDITQYYFIDFEGATAGSNFTADAEVLVEPVYDLWTVTSNASIINNTMPLSNLAWNGANQQITPNTISNTFSFTTSGLYNIYGSLSVNSANTISSVSLVEQQFTGLDRFGQANVVSQWNSPQASSPSVNFALPVQVTNPTKNNYSIVFSTNDTNAIGNTIAPSSFTVEYFGVVNNPTTPQQGNFSQNGLLVRASNTACTNYPLSTSNINLFSTSNVFGNSYHIAVTNGGNLSFSNVSQYRLCAYVETSNAYMANVTVWSAQNDATLATSLLPGNSAQAALVSSRTVPVGLSSGYTVDMMIPALISNTYQIRVGFSSATPGQQYTNVTANTYFTIVGTTLPGSAPVYSYVDSVGTYMIRNAELRMGGQSIQTLTGEMIEIYNDLFVSQENQPGLTLLTGKKDISTIYNPRTYYINLPFFFYGSAELSLPICALGLQDLEVWVTFNEYQSLLAPGTVNPTPSSVITSIVVDYAYLSGPEIEWFQKHRQDYIIQQNQYDTFRLGASLTFQMDFRGPVRELYFVIQDASDPPYVYETDTGLGVAITFNGEDYVDSSTMDYNFTRFIGPIEKYARQPDRILHVIPLCRHPLNPRPTGSVNMDRIYQKNIQFTLPNLTSLATKTLRLNAVIYNILRVENGLAGIMYQ
jgi:hypothetical protein